MSDESSPLFVGSVITISKAIVSLLRFAVNVGFDKHRTDQLLRIIKALIPAPNNLPTRHSRILRQLGRCTIFSTKYLCVHCDSRLIAHSDGRGRKTCCTPTCNFSRLILRSNQMTEVVALDIRSPLSSIVARNMSLLQGHKVLFPRSDPIHFVVYRQQQKDARERQCE